MIPLCYRCHNGGSDFICGVSIGCHPVAAYKYCLYQSLFHDGARHIITNQGHIHPCCMQFKRSKSRPLQKRSCLICKYMKMITSFFPQINRCCSSPIFTGGKLSGIAMGQNAITRLHQCQPVFSDTFADPDIFFLNLKGFFMKQFLYLCNRLIFICNTDFLHPV